MADTLTTKPLVGIVMGSRTDWETMQHAATRLDELGVAHEVQVVSAHRTPDRLFELVGSRWVDLCRLREVSEGDLLIPGVTILDMPGHSAGSIGVTVETDEGLVLIDCGLPKDGPELLALVRSVTQAPNQLGPNSSSRC